MTLKWSSHDLDCGSPLPLFVQWPEDGGTWQVERSAHDVEIPWESKPVTGGTTRQMMKRSSHNFGLR